jgi:hypothetical protein
VILDDLATRVGQEYGGGLDQFMNVLNLTQLTQGAVAAEVAPAETLDAVEDWYPIDPSLLTFKRVAVTEEVNGKQVDTGQTRQILGQTFSNGKFVPLNDEQVFYVPLDPDVDDPYGRSPLLPAIGAVVSMAQMLNDLKAFVHNQGYPRIDVQVAWEILKAAAPAWLQAPDKEREFAAWAQERLDQLVTDYNDLKVDDTFIHYDWVQVTTTGATGGGGTASLSVEALEKVLLHQLVSALKHLPILLGINEATSETHGSVQWQIFVAGVKTMQRATKRVIEKLANVTLQIYGIQAHAKVEFDAIRTVDRQAESTAEANETATRISWRDQGWIDNDEAARMMTGHDAVNDPLEMQLQAEEASLQLEQLYNPPANDLGAQQPTAKEKQQGASAKHRRVLRDVRAGRRQTSRQRRAIEGVLTVEELNDRAEKFGTQGGLIFMRQRDPLVELLEKQGIEIPEGEASRARPTTQEAKDVADQVFGLGYSREMKGMLRQAIREGLAMSGMGGDPDERLVRRIWKDNVQYVRKIRDDLKRALRSGEFKTLGDVRAWFDTNLYREELMGRYLAKQGLSGGWANGRSQIRGDTQQFVWELGANARHCGTCQERAGNTYTYEELISIGLPGSGELDCGANCKCSISEVDA